MDHLSVPTTDGAERLVRAPSTITTMHDSAITVHNLLDGRNHVLDAVGGRVWELLENGVTREDIVATVLREYALPDDVSSQQVGQDIDGLLTYLGHLGLVVGA